MPLAWKSVYAAGFIFLLLLAGCGEKQPPLEEQLQQAESLLDAGQIDGAIRLLEQSRERAPQRVDIMESLAFAYAAAGDPVLASMTFIEIADQVPQRPEYLLYAAESLLEAGDSKGAVAQHVAYLERRPEDRAVWVGLADLYAGQGLLSKALESLLAAERVESRPSQQLKIAQLYLRSNNLAQSQTWYARGLEGDHEERSEALLGLLEVAVRADRFADAEGLIEQLEAEFPGRLDQSPLAEVKPQLEAWRERQDAAAEAVAAINQRNRRPPNRPGGVEAGSPASSPEADLSQAPNRETLSRTGTGNPAMVARDSTSEAAASPPQTVVPEPVPAGPGPRPEPEPVTGPPSPSPGDEADPGTYLALARQAEADGNLDEAIRLVKRSLVMDDDQAAVWAELSELYLKSQNFRWAQATASEAVRRDPDNPKTHLQFIRAAQRTMDGDRIIREMEAAYRQFPDQPEIILVLARGYADAGNTRNARLLYNRFLERVPIDYPTRPAAEAELSLLR